MDNQAPRISIGLMTRNYGRFITEAISSVLAQNMVDWEMIIADDASTDETCELVVPFLTDNRIRYVKHRLPLGQAGNWSFCLQSGRAPIVGILHADDAYLPATLGEAVTTFESNPSIDLFYGNCMHVRPKAKETIFEARPGILTWKDVDRIMSNRDAVAYSVHHNRALPSATFLRRTVLASSGYPDPSLKMTVDSEFLWRFTIASNKVAMTGNPLAMYREHGGSTSAACFQDGTLAKEHARFTSTFRKNLILNRLASRLPQELLDQYCHSTNVVQLDALMRMIWIQLCSKHWQAAAWALCSCLDLLIQTFVIGPNPESDFLTDTRN